jgi:hypothetical protein
MGFERIFVGKELCCRSAIPAGTKLRQATWKALLFHFKKQRQPPPAQ